MQKPGIRFLLEPKVFPVLLDGLALSVIEKTVEVIQKVPDRDPIEFCQLVHDFFWVIVYGPGLQISVMPAADPNAVCNLLLHQAHMVTAPAEPVLYG